MTFRAPAAIAVFALAAAVAVAPAGRAAQPAAPRTWQPPRPTEPTVSYLPDSTVLARFEGVPIRAGEVVARYFDALPTERPDADSLGRVSFLHTMVDQQVMGRIARQVNKPLDFEDRAKMRETEQRVLSNELFKRYVVDSVVVDTADVRRLYDQFGNDWHMRWMLFADHATAVRVRAALARKTLTWDAAYAQYHRGLKRPDHGDLGWFDRLSNPDRFPSSIYRLKPGEVSEVWNDIGGWNLLQCVEVHPKLKPPFKVIQTRLQATAQQSAINARSERLLARLRSRAHVAYDTANVVWVAERFAIADLEAGPRRTVRLVHRVPTFAPEDTGRVLARFDGGAMSVIGFLHAYSELPPVSRPVVDTPERLHRQIDATVLEPQRAEFARELGYQRAPAVVTELEKRREGLLVEHLYGDSIEAKTVVTPAMRRKYYDDNLPQFVTYARVHFGIVIADRKSEADSLVTRIKAGTSVAQILLADSLAHRATRGSVRWISQVDQGAPLYALLFNELKPGQVMTEGPDEDGQYPVIQSIEFDPGHQLSYDESVNLADAAAQNLESERLLKLFVDRHRKRFRIEEHPELVMRVRWRDPSMTDRTASN